jgi:hypothetical protein
MMDQHPLVEVRKNFNVPDQHQIVERRGIMTRGLQANNLSRSGIVPFDSASAAARTGRRN